MDMSVNLSQEAGDITPDPGQREVSQDPVGPTMSRTSFLELVTARQANPLGKVASEANSRTASPGTNESRSTSGNEKSGGTPSEIGVVALGLRPVSTTDADDLWTAQEIAAALRVPTKSVYSLGIPCVPVSTRRYRYWRSDILAYLAGKEDAA
jgi:hypothetical protein